MTYNPAYKKRYDEIHRKENAIYQRQYALEHKEEREEYLRVYFSARKKEKAAYDLEYDRSHPEKVLAKSRNRRARKIVGGGRFTAMEWKSLLERYNNTCLCCRRNDVKLTADHVIPLSKGGSNSIDNIQPLCKSCNSKKHAKHIDYRPL